MKLRSIAATMAALTLTVSPVLAQAAVQAPASSQVERAVAKSDKNSKAAPSTGIIIGVLAAAAVITGIVIAADNDDDDTPTSP